MKIVIADPLPSSAAELLRDQGWNIDAKTGRPPEELYAALADADALIVRSATQVDAELIAKAPGLKVIARAGTGVDNVDLDAASAGGILVVNAPGANSISVIGPLDRPGRRPDEGRPLGEEAADGDRVAG
jgi:D-3-phosphoglycerate dehydrogenase